MPLLAKKSENKPVQGLVTYLAMVEDHECSVPTFNGETVLQRGRSGFMNFKHLPLPAIRRLTQSAAHDGVQIFGSARLRIKLNEEGEGRRIFDSRVKKTDWPGSLMPEPLKFLCV